MEQEQPERLFECIYTCEIKTKIKPGDNLEVSFSPQSQKYLLLDPEEYERWFPTYTGIVISSNHTTIDGIILQNPITKETYACENKSGDDESMPFIKRFFD
jgi:hypothetical protein